MWFVKIVQLIDMATKAINSLVMEPHATREACVELGP